MVFKVLVFLPKGYEEILPEEVYSTSGGALWIEEETKDYTKLAFYTEYPDTLLFMLKERFGAFKWSIFREVEKNYESIVRGFFKPIKVGNLRIVPPWTKKKDSSSIIIEPGMAFGTGRHESTKIMILLMEKVDFIHKKVLDLGCGSGILSIYASSLGAKKVLAVDCDDEAVISAKKNVKANCKKNVNIKKKDISEVKGKFDIVLANLDIGLFSHYMQKILDLGKKNAKFLFSGILWKERKLFLPLLGEQKILEEKRLGAWVGFLIEKK